MNRDSKGRFQRKGLFIPFPSASLVANLALILFISLPWIYVCAKFKILERFYDSLSFLFLDIQQCGCENGDTNKY